MDLHTQHRHLYGKKVGVGDKQYDVDPHGVVSGVAEEHAQVLMQIPGWQSVESAESNRQVALKRSNTKGSVLMPPGDGSAMLPPRELSEEEQAEVPRGGKTPEISPEDVKSGLAQWPDPTVDMDVDYLRQMADAYKIQHSLRTSKATLVARIMDAMYPAPGRR